MLQPEDETPPSGPPDGANQAVQSHQDRRDDLRPFDGAGARPAAVCAISGPAAGPP